MVRRFFSIFRRLQWKLAFSYMATTVVVLTLLLGMAMFFSTQMLFGLPQYGSVLLAALQEDVKQISPALSAQPPDRATLQAWLDQIYHNRGLQIGASNPDEGPDFAGLVGAGSWVLITDRQGQVLAKTVTSAAELDEEEQLVLSNALRGAMEEADLLRSQSDEITLAVPVFDGNQQVVGAVLISVRRPNTMEVLGVVAQASLSGAMFFAVLAGLIGILFGLLVARGLTRRLYAITRVTASWGSGDFSARIEDRSGDEIGMLAADLNRMADDWQALMQTRQELAMLEERNRLARDLHDSVKQEVFAISMNLGAAQTLWNQDPQAARQQVDAAAALARHSRQELTGLIQTLRPAQLKERDLLQGLREFLAEWERSRGIRVLLNLPDSLHLPAEMEQAIFRVVQEAFANVARHSRASAVSLELRLESGGLRMLISDNGHGFDLQRVQPGLGLLSMKERFQTLGGWVQIESNAAGTRLEGWLPMEVQP
jgi:signal transduction histidine kinase